MSDVATAPATDHPRDVVSRRWLLIALGVDNLGSGLFLPLAVVYITTVLDVPLATAGLLVTTGTLVGLFAPPLAGALVDRHGPKRVVVASNVLQVIGMAVYLAADGPLTTLLAAALVAAGTQTFYSAVFALIADVAPAGPKDHTFATVEMVRSAAFGAGALLAALLVSTVDVGVLGTALVLNTASFVLSAVLLATLVHPRRHATPTTPAPDPAAAGEAPRSVWANRPYLALIVVTTLLALPADFLLVGLAVYLLQVDQSTTWAGASIATLTVLVSTLNAVVVRRTITWARTTAMALGGCCFLAWALSSAAAPALPTGWVGPWVLGSSLLLAAGALLFGTRVNALAEAAAPPASRGRHLAAFQYSFTAAGLLAPLLVSSMAVALWLPWALTAAAAGTGAVAILLLAQHLPAAAVRAT